MVIPIATYIALSLAILSPSWDLNADSQTVSAEISKAIRERDPARVHAIIESEPGMRLDLSLAVKALAMAVAIEDNGPVINCLLAGGANVNDRLPTGPSGDGWESPVSLAAERDCPNNVTVLLQCGANVRAEDSDGRTILGSVLRDGVTSHSVPTRVIEPDYKLVSLLIKSGAPVTDPLMRSQFEPLAIALEEGHFAVAALLEKAGATIGSRSSYALIGDARTGRAADLKVQLSLGANVDATDEDGRSSLMLAAERSYREVVKILIHHRAAIDLTDNTTKETALIKAIWSGLDNRATDDLIIAGANLDVQDTDGDSALKVAARLHDSRIVRMLVAYGANVNSRDTWGGTALTDELSTYRGYGVHTLIVHRDSSADEDLALTRLLVDSGADVNARLNSGEIATSIARTRGYRRSYQLLSANSRILK